MKTSQKSLLLVLPLLFLFLSLSSCESCENQDPQDDDTSQNDDDGQNTDDEPDYEGAPDNIISLEQAKSIYDSYTERRIGLIQQTESPNDDGSPFNPSRYGEWDFETIKHWIAYVEQEAEDVEVEVSGMRFYFANYPDNSNGDLERHNTIFLLPTTNINGQDQGFLTQTNENGQKELVLIADILEGFGKGQQLQSSPTGMNTNKNGGHPKMLMLPLTTVTPPTSSNVQQINSLILNEAHMIPPPNQATEFDN